MLRACSSSLRSVRTMQASAPVVKKISKVLVANRGEIAIRVMNTAKKMGIKTVAVFSEADKNALFTKHADNAYHIGPALASASYLNIEKVINAALDSGAQAIHPGYGFLSENSTFAEECRKAGLVFIGPPVRAIRDMGTKSVAKQIMQDANVPVVEGFHGADQSDANLKIHSERIGYPVMLKAVYGGGGKGMRIAWNKEEFDEKLASARSEAMKSFGNDEMLVEKFVERPRHVEVQVFGDHHGNYVHLWERDCSVQRRHQKIIEEAPAPGLDMATRNRLGESAVRAAAAVNYVGAGTVEFIMDPRGEFYFMEMNTRLQVEHPVTEAITGTDLVEWQLRVAQGEELPLKQKDIPLRGHAFECRIYAEDTVNGSFMPTAGKLDYVNFPSAARVDTGVKSGDEVSVHYDPMIAKVVVWADNRESAVSKLDSALKNTLISGLPTNIDFVRTVLGHEEFKKGNVYTDFIPDFQSELFAVTSPAKESIIEAAVGSFLSNTSLVSDGEATPFQVAHDFRVNLPSARTFQLGKQSVEVSFTSMDNISVVWDKNVFNCKVTDVTKNNNETSFTIEFNGKRWPVKTVELKRSVVIVGEHQGEYEKASTDVVDTKTADDSSSTTAVAPMPGIIEKILVKAGEKVKQGQALVVMTAMKMEYIIKAPTDCEISKVSCAAGKNVAKNSILVSFEPVQ